MSLIIAPTTTALCTPPYYECRKEFVAALLCRRNEPRARCRHGVAQRRLAQREAGIMVRATQRFIRMR